MRKVRRKHQRRLQETPRVYADGANMVVSLDGSRGLNKDGQVIHSPHPLSLYDLRFSVTRNGKLKFAKKITLTPQFEERERLDENGNKIPNAKREKELERWGHSYQPEFETENAVLDEPHVKQEYDVDREWWRRHAYTTVVF